MDMSAYSHTLWRLSTAFSWSLNRTAYPSAAHPWFDLIANLTASFWKSIRQFVFKGVHWIVETELTCLFKNFLCAWLLLGCIVVDAVKISQGWRGVFLVFSLTGTSCFWVRSLFHLVSLRGWRLRSWVRHHNDDFCSRFGLRFGDVSTLTVQFPMFFTRWI